MLPQDQKQKLHAAIDLAQGSGGCRYTMDGRPFCVIAQLAALEGVPVEQLQVWDCQEREVGSSATSSASVYEVLESNLPGSEVLKTYPPDLLASLQETWDEGATDVYQARLDMHDMVNRPEPEAD